MWHDSSVPNLIHGLVLFFIFQIIGESARFRVLRKTSSHLTPSTPLSTFREIVVWEAFLETLSFQFVKRQTRRAVTEVGVRRYS